MAKIIGALADRMLRVIVPDTTAGACACTPGDSDYYCDTADRLLFYCHYNCYCSPINCTVVGVC